MVKARLEGVVVAVEFKSAIEPHNPDVTAPPEPGHVRRIENSSALIGQSSPGKRWSARSNLEVQRPTSEFTRQRSTLLFLITLLTPLHRQRRRARPFTLSLIVVAVTLSLIVVAVRENAVYSRTHVAPSLPLPL